MTSILEFLTALLMAFVLLSVLASSIQEFYSARVGKNTRSVMLYQSLLKVFNDRSNRNFTDDLYRHPLIEKSKPDEKSLPAYIEDTVFATVLTDVFIRQARKITITYDVNGKPVAQEPPADPDKSLDLFKNAVEGLEASDTKKLLQSFIATAADGKSLAVVKTEIMTWYNAYMDRVTGWYKKKVKDELFWIALCMAIFMNIDVFRLASGIWNDKGLQSALIMEAEKAVADSAYIDNQNCASKTGEEKIRCIREKYDKIRLSGLPIGWISEPAEEEKNSGYWRKVGSLVKRNFNEFFSLSTILGWLITAFILRQGAPFWFEALSKVVNLRGAGTRPRSSTQDENQPNP